jgi:hypothetical protein
MPPVSEKQRKLFGAVVHCKKTGKCASAGIKKIADGISMQDAKDFASHPKKHKKHKKRKKHISEGFIPFSVWLEAKENNCTCKCKSCKDGYCSECSCKDCNCEGCKC